MDTHRDTTELKERLAAEGYRVDPVAVADAIVRRRWTIHATAGRQGVRAAALARPTSTAALAVDGR